MPFAARLPKRAQPALMASDGADAGIVSGIAAPRPDTGQPTHRGRLFRKYLLLILSLVTIALLASGGIGFYFSYQENREALASLQHEKAIAAASRIEQYITGIEQQLKYAALPQLGSAEVELRRIEFLKLLRQVPEITDIAQIDARCRVTNVGSRRVIQKCGFQFQGTGMVPSLAVGSTVPVEWYRLDRKTWMSLRSWGGMR